MADHVGRALTSAAPLQIVDNQVVYVRTKSKEGYYALQVGAVNHPKKHRVSTLTLAHVHWQHVCARVRTCVCRCQDLCAATLPRQAHL